jgi:outer membrane receptor protein involved in Fe transport
MRAAIFHYDIKDFMNDNGIAAPGTGLGSDCLYNIDHFKLYGAELEASIKLGDRFSATAAYVYQDYDVTETSFEKDWTYYLPQLLPHHKIKLSGQYRILQDGLLRLNARYVSERNAQKTKGGEKVTLDDYATVDVGYEHNLKLKGVNFGIGAYINNLTGTNYQEIAGYDMPRQVYGVKVSCKF